MQLKWYALRVRQGREEKTIAAIAAVFKKNKLEDSLGRIHAPFERAYVVKKGKHEIKKIFFGYLLAEIDLEHPKARETLLEAENVFGFVTQQGWTRTGDPTPVPEEEIAHMLSDEKKQDITKSIEKKFCMGDEVSIIEGPFKGRKGIVHKLDNASNKVEIVLELFRQDTIVSFNYNQIQ